MSRLIDKVKALEAKNAKSIRKQEFWSSLAEHDKTLFREIRDIFGQYHVQWETPSTGSLRDARYGRCIPFAPINGEVPYGNYLGNVSKPQVFGRFCKRKLPQKSFGGGVYPRPGESSESEADDL